jgi:uncharacterized membrane protein
VCNDGRTSEAGRALESSAGEALAMASQNPYLFAKFFNVGNATVPLIFLILLIVLIAQIGFWNTLGAILGAFAMVALLVIIGIAVVVIGGMMLLDRATRPRS